MKTSGNVNFSHSAAERRQLPGLPLTPCVRGWAKLAEQPLVRLLLGSARQGSCSHQQQALCRAACVQFGSGHMSVLQPEVDCSLENIPSLLLNKSARIAIRLETRQRGLVFQVPAASASLQRLLKRGETVPPDCTVNTALVITAVSSVT